MGGCSAVRHQVGSESGGTELPLFNSLRIGGYERPTKTPININSMYIFMGRSPSPVDPATCFKQEAFHGLTNGYLSSRPERPMWNS
jgi:hypothetical protein